VSGIDTGTEHLLLDTADGIATVTLNRPDVKNAVTPEMLDALAVVLADLDADAGVRAIVLTGAGAAFCAGGDVKAFAERGGDVPVGDDGVQDWFDKRARRQVGVVGRLRSMTTPSIAALPGAAAGAGLGLALACDLRVGGPSTLLTTAFIKIGLPGDFGVAWQLRDLIGVGPATRLMLLSDRVGADEALGLGLLDWLVPDDEVRSTAREIAGRLAASSAQAIGAMKANLRDARHLDLGAAMDAELVRYRACADGDEHKAAVRAFAERGRSTGTTPRRV
jgi:2-(1,2-epoxy-1,2-dihydrophenyl)acetyl-CoA isomerase